MKKFLLTSFSVFFVIAFAMAQDRVISGKVTAADDGSSLPGVNVILKGTAIGAVSDADGNYKISVPNSGGTLAFSFIGFQTLELVIDERSVLDVSLQSDVTQLSEVVVTTAGGLQSRARELGSAVSILTPKDITAGQAVNLVQGLQGKVAGVSISATGSGPNPDFRIVMRGQRSLTGNNQALIILDGVIVPNNILSNLNMNDIDNVTTLNGAGAAALYGSQASNGALVITTKRGKSGKTDITISQSYQFNQVAFTPKIQKRFGAGGSAYGTDPGTIGAFNYLENQSYGAAFDGSLRPLGPPLEDGTQLYTSYAYKDGHDQFWNIGVTSITDFSLSNGDDKSSLFVSGQFASVEGTTPGDKFKRGNIRVNGTRKIGEKVAVSYSTLYAPNRWDITTQTGAIYDNMLNMPSNVDITKFKDWRNNKFATPDGFYNPWYLNPYFNAANWREKDKNDYLTANLELKFMPISGLDLIVRQGISSRTFEQKQWNGKYLYSEYAKHTDQSAKIDIPANLNEYSFNTVQLVTDFLAQYNRNFSDFNVNLVGGVQLVENTARHMATGIGGLVVDDLNNLGNGVGTPNFNQAQFQTRLMGVFGKVVLGYKDFAFLTATGRNDWDSRLNEENRSFFYPSVEGSVLLSEAISSLKGNSLISYLKVRGGVSKTGLVNLNSNVFGYPDLGAYNTKPVFTSGNNGFPYGSLAGYSVGNRLVSKDLKPEITNSFEVGFDLNLFKDKITSSVTYFHSTTIDQVVEAFLSNSTGFNRLLTNSGKTENYGIEAALHVTPLKTSDWEVTVGGNFTYLQNKVISISEQLPLLALQNSGNAVSAAVEGQSFPVIMGLDYVRDPQGRVIVDKVTGLPSATSSNVILGNATPKYRLGTDAVVTYKTIRLSFLFEFRGGYKVFHGMGNNMDWSGTSWRTAIYDRKSFVFPNSVYDDGDGNYVENKTIAIANGGGNNGFWSDGINRNTTSNYVTSGNFVKLREIALSYDLPSALIGKVPGKFLKGATISVQGRNLFLWMAKDNYYTDPEYSSGGSGSNGIGLNDISQTPPTRAFGGTVSLRF